MRKIVIALFSIMMSFGVFAQNNEVISEEIVLDFSEPAFVIDWQSPEGDGATITGLETTIRFSVKAQNEIDLVKIYVNGETEDPTNPYRSRSDDRVRRQIEMDVKLNAGENEILVAVKDIEGNRESFTISITANNLITLADLGRKDRALIIATNEYDEWGDLVNPIDDARAIADELSAYYGFEVVMVENPTQQEILLKIREYAQKEYNEYDQLFIFIAGHGQFDEVNGQGYVVARDSKLDDPVKTSYINHPGLRTQIDNIGCRHILLAMDVCFGGTFDQSIANSGSRGAEEMYTELNSVSYFKREMRFTTRKYITSGGKEYVSDGIPGQHSPFAAKFLEALRNYGGRDEFLTITELYSYMERMKMVPKAGDFGRNQPGSNFLFVAVEK